MPLLALGTFLVGSYQGFAQFYRFAASEVADEAYRPRGIAFVLGYSIVAAFLGPILARLGGPLFDSLYVGSFLPLALASLAAAGTLLGLRIPQPKLEDCAEAPADPGAQSSASRRISSSYSASPQATGS